ncbi:hypothetical protein ACQQCD_07335 [Pseudarthrobacter sp. J1763]|uniref:hypothetical protein n=1 Tax=Pseudarthrobacter sp. J1763 TaxID=3420445 RepID=UPI003D2B7CC6
MTAHQSSPGDQADIPDDVANHLGEAISMSNSPTAPPVSEAKPKLPEAQHWPDGNGKHKHPNDHLDSHGRSSGGAGANAIHRTSRPQMPHSN